MAQDYKITKISQQPPREWGEGERKTYYIKVMLEGHVKPVSIGKKKPDALKVGDTVHGSIVETQYEEDKFQAERQQGQFGFSRRDDMAIRAQWAIGQAVQLAIHDKDIRVEEQAKVFYAMVDRVKGSDSASPIASGYEKAKQTRASLPVSDEQPPIEAFSADEVQHDFDPEEPINLEDIPF